NALLFDRSRRLNCDDSVHSRLLDRIPAMDIAVISIFARGIELNDMSGWRFIIICGFRACRTTAEPTRWEATRKINLVQATRRNARPSGLIVERDVLSLSTTQL